MANEMDRGEQGASLIEILIAAALTVTVITVVVGVLYTGQRGHRSIADFGDNVQQLRTAMNQISSDFRYARWGGPPALSDTVEVLALQPVVSKSVSTYDWTGHDGWPGDMRDWHEVKVLYSIDGGVLYRQVYDDGWGIYSRHALVSNLVTGVGKSRIEVDEIRQIVKVYLVKSVSGGSRNVDAYSEFYLR